MNDEAVNAIAELARRGTELEVKTFDSNGVPYYRTPEGKAERCEWMLNSPVRKRATPVFHDRESFSRYVNEHETESTRIFANISSPPGGVTAVMDYHEQGPDGSAHWGDHRPRLQLAHSEAFLLWTKHNNQNFDQKAFALFLEENLADIRSPDGASVLECAIHLQGKTSANFQKSIRLENGNQSLQYVEQTISGGGAKGDLEVPKLLELLIPVFKGEVPTSILARLRHRIEGGGVTFRYELHRLQEAVDAGLTQMLETIENETKIAPFRGMDPLIT